MHVCVGIELYMKLFSYLCIQLKICAGEAIYDLQ